MTKSKTASDRLAAAKLALLKAEEAAAREVAKDNPTIEALSEFLDSINAEINVNSRLLNGPNSFENRLNSIRKRTEWIDAQMSLTNAQDELLRSRKIILQAHISSLANAVADGATELPEVQTVLDSLPQPAFAQLIEDENTAKNAWKESTPAAITAQMKADKNAAKVVDGQDLEEASA
tara:strand:- start:351 stop:884 length:534 start_codon:yes stop_codon:yes gene_type:complete